MTRNHTYSNIRLFYTNISKSYTIYTNISKNVITRHNMAEHLVLPEGRFEQVVTLLKMQVKCQRETAGYNC